MCVDPIVQIKPPDGFELIPDDLANPEPSTSHSFSGGGRGDQTEREVAEGKVSDEVVEGDGDNTRQNPTSSGHRVFLCIKASTQQLCKISGDHIFTVSYWLERTTNDCHLLYESH